MGLNYDDWLEQPYQDGCDAQDNWEIATEKYCESNEYWDDLADYQFANPGKDEDDFLSSSQYEGLVESYWERLNEPPDPPEDREYRTRGW